MRWWPAVVLLVPSVAFAADADDGRFYAGLAATMLEYTAEHDGLDLDDRSPGVALYGGYQWRDNLALEVSLQSDRDALDLRDIAGSGTHRLDVSASRDTVSVKAVGELSLQDWLSWRRNWRVFGTLGYYRGDVDRTVTDLASGTRAIFRDDDAGLLIGTGFLYQIGVVDLRGYVEWYGVLDDREAWDAGVAVQLSF